MIEDVDGNKFIDFAGGIGCLNSGHRPAEITSALRGQIEKYLHLCFSVTPYEGYVAVAEKLNALTPGKFAKKTFLVNSGAEAIENAVKIARAYTKRPSIIAFNDAGRFPEYYDSKARVDESHLVREAAEKFTIALARELRWCEYTVHLCQKGRDRC